MPKLIIPPRRHDLGGGFTVNRVLPYARQRMVGPFIFWDHMGPVAIARGDEMNVRPHPHIGLATLTWLFEGEIFHHDSLGFAQAIRPGEVNWMTAGRGIVHSERTAPIASAVRGQRVHGIQLWVALPRAQEECEPSFHHFAAEAIPAFREGEAELRLIAGELLGRRSPVPVHSPLFYSDVRLPAGGRLTLPLGSAEGGLYVLSGKLLAGDAEVGLRSMAVFAQGDELAIRALEPVHCMLLGGEPFPEGRHIWWNFVHSSKERIERAKHEWREGGFARVPGETDFIPLPEGE